MVNPRWLRDLFEDADKNGDGTLDLKEVVAMLRRLNVGVSKRVIKRKFEVSLRSCDQSCDRLHKYTIDLFILLHEFHRTCSVNSETSVTTHTSIKFKYIYTTLAWIYLWK